MPYLEIGPAYGRDYKNQAAVKEDWNADKDFKVLEGGPYGAYTNRADILRLFPDTTVIVRYDRQMKLVTVKGK